MGWLVFMYGVFKKRDLFRTMLVDKRYCLYWFWLVTLVKE